MVHVALSIVASPDRHAAFVQALRALMLPAQAATGFVSCRLFQEADDPGALYYVEEWRTAEDLNRQIQSPRYTRLLALMEEAAEPPELRLSWVTDVKGLEYLAEVRRKVSSS